MISLTQLDVGKVLINSDRKGPFSTSHVLFLTGTCQKVYYILRGTGSEMFHRVSSMCNRGLKGISFTSTVGIV